MDIAQLALALGASLTAGLNLYITILTLGLLNRYDVLDLPESMQILSHPWVIITAAVLFLIEFVADKIEKKELKFKEIKRKVTYQDPCRLGRHLGIYDSPRKVLEAIPGVELVEMEKNRECALCCGTSAFTNCDIYSHEMRVDRLREAKATGAEVLTTTCPKCQIHFRCAMNNKGEEKGPDINMQVTDLANLVASAIDS